MVVVAAVECGSGGCNGNGLLVNLAKLVGSLVCGLLLCVERIRTQVLRAATTPKSSLLHLFFISGCLAICEERHDKPLLG
jgi:hypothetical protein